MRLTTSPDTTRSFFREETVDDLLRAVVTEIRLHGVEIAPSRGKAMELTGTLLELLNPRARLSRTETRGKIFSCLGELCWYLAKSNSADFISYYIPRYLNEAEDGIIYGAYGPRLFDFRGHDQIGNVIDRLKKESSTRRAVIQLFDAADISKEHKEIPCTCTLQFLVRGSALHMVTMMRSNDVFLGLPHDIFCFTMIQEIVARTLGCELGSYKHAVGSLHVYHHDADDVDVFLNEGWQSTDQLMPPMPVADPWSSVKTLVAAEEQIRMGGLVDSVALTKLDPYWADLVRLLQVLACSKVHNVARMQELLRNMESVVFTPFIQARIDAATT